MVCSGFFFQAEDGIRDLVRSRGLGDVYKRQCLVRAEVLSVLGGLDASFDTLAGAALEAGHRWIRHGALMAYVPDLLPAGAVSPPAEVTPADEFRFLRRRYGCLLYTSPSPRDRTRSRMPSSA